jgi:glycosyltransferase involved in cell wall biosynthesis
VKKIFIIVPALYPTGPIKGAYALANSLVDYCNVTIVTVRSGDGAGAWLDPRVRSVCLAEKTNKFWSKVDCYKSLLRDSGDRKSIVSLSLCLSADFINLFCKAHAFTYCSVRANLFVNYRHDYGILGVALAFLHFFSLRWFDRVIAMNQHMANQIKKYSQRKPDIIGNCIDEDRLKSYISKKSVSDPFTFVFVGSLTRRKQPKLLVNALFELNRRGVAAQLEYIGSGPEKSKIEAEVKRLKLTNYVNFHGFLERPELILNQADAFILPSLSEGISRAAMEALYLGIPCVLRGVDGNLEILEDGLNGAVFNDDQDLPDVMLKAALLSRENVSRKCLLPTAFRQHVVVQRYMDIMEITYD